MTIGAYPPTGGYEAPESLHDTEPDADRKDDQWRAHTRRALLPIRFVPLTGGNGRESGRVARSLVPGSLLRVGKLCHSRFP